VNIPRVVAVGGRWGAARIFGSDTATKDGVAWRDALRREATYVGKPTWRLISVVPGGWFSPLRAPHLPRCNGLFWIEEPVAAGRF
jgi:hypothetical protein